MRLILLRHGQSPSNVLHVLDTVVPGPPLTMVGEEQAQRVTDRLADESVDAVYASTHMRAQMIPLPMTCRLNWMAPSSGIDLLQPGPPLDQRPEAQILAVEVHQVEGDEDQPLGLPADRRAQRREIRQRSCRSSRSPRRR